MISSNCCGRKQGDRNWVALTVQLSLLGVVLITLPFRAQAAPFAFLQAGFTQELYATGPNFFGGVAFAPDGDVWVDPCDGNNVPLRRFDAQTTVVVNGTTIHPEVLGSPFLTTVGCGLTNHPNGTMYSNSSGVNQLDVNTGAELKPAFGPDGNDLGIAPDPQTGNLVYVGSGGTIQFVDPALTTSGIFSMVTTGNFVDGIFFDPTGNFLFTSNRSSPFSLTIINHDGTLAQKVTMTSEPDGIAFHSESPKFVVTNNTNGTMTRFDFPGDDFTQVPVQSVFASGGFRGDLSQVGKDGCLYLTQAGTRFDDGTTTGDNSVVRICGGFAAPPGVGGDPFGGLVRTSTRRVRLTVLRLSPDDESVRCVETDPADPDYDDLPFTPFPNDEVEIVTVLSAGNGIKNVCCQYMSDTGSLASFCGEVLLDEGAVAPAPAMSWGMLALTVALLFGLARGRLPKRA